MNCHTKGDGESLWCTTCRRECTNLDCDCTGDHLAPREIGKDLKKLENPKKENQEEYYNGFKDGIECAWCLLEMSTEMVLYNAPNKVANNLRKLIKESDKYGMFTIEGVEAVRKRKTWPRRSRI